MIFRGFVPLSKEFNPGLWVPYERKEWTTLLNTEILRRGKQTCEQLKSWVRIADFSKQGQSYGNLFEIQRFLPGFLTYAEKIYSSIFIKCNCFATIYKVKKI